MNPITLEARGLLGMGGLGGGGAPPGKKCDVFVANLNLFWGIYLKKSSSFSDGIIV